MALICPMIQTAQLMTRFQLDWLSRQAPLESVRKTFVASMIVFMVIWTLSLGLRGFSFSTSFTCCLFKRISGETRGAITEFQATLFSTSLPCCSVVVARPFKWCVTRTMKPSTSIPTLGAPSMGSRCTLLRSAITSHRVRCHLLIQQSQRLPTIRTKPPPKQPSFEPQEPKRVTDHAQSVTTLRFSASAPPGPTFSLSVYSLR